MKIKQTVIEVLYSLRFYSRTSFFSFHSYFSIVNIYSGFIADPTLAIPSSRPPIAADTATAVDSTNTAVAAVGGGSSGESSVGGAALSLLDPPPTLLPVQPPEKSRKVHLQGRTTMGFLKALLKVYILVNDFLFLFCFCLNTFFIYSFPPWTQEGEQLLLCAEPEESLLREAILEAEEIIRTAAPVLAHALQWTSTRMFSLSADASSDNVGGVAGSSRLLAAATHTALLSSSLLDVETEEGVGQVPQLLRLPLVRPAHPFPTSATSSLITCSPLTEEGDEMFGERVLVSPLGASRTHPASLSLSTTTRSSVAARLRLQHDAHSQPQKAAAGTDYFLQAMCCPYSAAVMEAFLLREGRYLHRQFPTEVEVVSSKSSAGGEEEQKTVSSSTTASTGIPMYI